VEKQSLPRLQSVPNAERSVHRLRAKVTERSPFYTRIGHVQERFAN
jgi:hypothetical protein